MEFKGTKGDWYIKNGQICSSIYCGDQQLALRASSKPEGRANILLMSKAPEMLYMLKECLDTFRCSDQNDRELKHRIEELINSATTI